MSKNIADIFHFSKNNAKFLAVTSVMIVILSIDLSVSNVSDMIGKEMASSWGIASFIATAAVNAAGQYFILEMVKKGNRETTATRSSRFRRINTGVTITQYVLLAIIGFVIVELVLASSYHTAALVAETTISYALAGVTIGILAAWFFSWYRSSRNVATLLYGLSSAMVAASTALMLVFYDLLLLAKPAEVNPQSQVAFQFFDPSSPMGMLQYSFTIFNIVNFMLLWTSTVLLLRHYSQKIGKVKLWAVLGIPLASFLGIFFVVTPLVTSSTPQDADMVYVVVFGYTLPGIAGGVLFGVPFWIVARSIGHAGIRTHMIITACGFVLSFISGTATVAQAPYPPFGLAGVSFTGLASYLILSGLYSSVVSISEDVKLRQTIRRSAMEESRLLDSFGLAHIKGEIQKRVIMIARDNSDSMASETGISPSLTEDDMREYLSAVLEEIGSRKEKKGVRDAAAE